MQYYLKEVPCYFIFKHQVGAIKNMGKTVLGVLSRPFCMMYYGKLKFGSNLRVHKVLNLKFRCRDESVC